MLLLGVPKFKVVPRKRPHEALNFYLFGLNLHAISFLSLSIALSGLNE